MKKNSAPNCLKQKINTKNIAFFHWCQNDSSISYSSFQGFSERISCDPTSDSWSLNRRNEIVCIVHLLLYKIMIYSFLFWPGSETLVYDLVYLSLSNNLCIQSINLSIYLMLHPSIQVCLKIPIYIPVCQEIHISKSAKICIYIYIYIPVC